MEEKIMAYPRVMSEKLDGHEYCGKLIDGKKNLSAPSKWGEVVEIRAVGHWGEHQLPISVHLSVPPGHPVLPFMGDCLKIVVSADDRGPNRD